MEANLKLTQDDGELLEDPSMYRRVIGKLLYLTITRPDISFAVNRLSQFLSKPRVPHYKATMRILQYLKSSPGRGLFYPANSELHLKAFVDSDWAACSDTRRYPPFVFSLVNH